MFENKSKNDLTVIECNYCLQKTTEWMIICNDCHHLRSFNCMSDVRIRSPGLVLPSEASDQVLTSKVNYLLFGTFVFYCQPLELSTEFLRLYYVSVNPTAIGITYDLRISFEDIRRLLYLTEFGNPLVFIELKRSTNLMIRSAMNLDNERVKGLKFDVDSDDLVDRYLVIDFDEVVLNHKLIPKLIQIAEQTNKVIVRQMTSSNAYRYLNQNYRKYESCIKSLINFRDQD